MKPIAFEIECEPGQPSVIPSEVTSRLPAGNIRVVLLTADSAENADRWGAFALQAMWAEEDPRDAEYDLYLSE